MLTVKDFLPLWSLTKSGFLFHRAGSSPRCPSPRRRVSQRMTSAPNSHSTRATVGPAAPVVNSTTRIPSSGSLGIDCAPELWSIGILQHWSSDYEDFARIDPILHHSITRALDFR